MGGKFDFSSYLKNEREELMDACALTERQRDVFETRARTDSVAATAQKLMVSEATVKRESRRISEKIRRCANARARARQEEGIKESRACAGNDL